MTQHRLRVRTIFNIATLSLVAAVAMLAFATMIGTRDLQLVRDEQRLSREVTDAVLDLNILASEFQLGWHPRIERQWRTRMSSLETLLNETHQVFGYEDRLFAEFSRQATLLEDVFEGLSNRVRAEDANNPANVQARRVLMLRFLSASHSLASLADQLSRHAVSKANEVQERLLYYGGASIILILAVAIITHGIFRSRVLTPLLDLRNHLETLEVEGFAEPGRSRPEGDEFSEVAAELRARTEALKNSEGRYRDLVDGSIQGMLVHAGDRLMFANASLARIFGYRTGEEVLASAEARVLLAPPPENEGKGKSKSKSKSKGNGATPPSDADAAEGKDSPDETDGSSDAREVQAYKRDGTPITLLLLSKPVEWDDQAATQCTVIDITEQKQAAQLRQQFVSTVSHELRTPLTSIRGSLSVIKGGVVGELSEKQRDIIDLADRNVERLALLVNDILDFEKLETGIPSLKLATIDAVALTESAVEENKGYADELGVTIELSVDTPCVLAVQGDWDRLQQVLANLISNAAKFSPNGETVALHVNRLDRAARISVTDNGPGIPREYHTRIFEPFAQVDGTDSRKAYGTGLGLSISKQIMKAHGGEISIHSAVGEGSTFYLTLPLSGGIGSA